MSVQLRLPRMTTRPTVSVVIPNYNYGAYLPTAVHSVLDQDGVDVEVIIVDDCSTDGSLEIAFETAAHERVSLISHERNMRHIATYNDGLARAGGTYVVLMSADDALAPGSLQRATMLMEAEPGVGLVYGHPRDFTTPYPPNDAEPVSWSGAELTWTKWAGEEWVWHMCRRGRNMVRSPEVVMRTSVLHELGGGWDARFPHSADMYLWARAAAHADVGRVNGRIQAYYRVHAANMHSTEFGGLLDDFEARRDTYQAFFEADGHLLSRRGQLEKLWRRRLAREALRQIVYLPRSAERPDRARALLDFAANLAPRDRIIRAFYSVAVSGSLGASSMHHGLHWAWFQVEWHRAFLREERELRIGT
jgi:glycosyltransferase involved in cell wall biosynthesis